MLVQTITQLRNGLPVRRPEKPFSGWFHPFLWGILFFASPQNLLGVSTATLSGRVTNSIGGVLAGAEVEATNLDINAVFRTKTSQLGLYRIPLLPPGSYRVVVRFYGFRTIVKPGVRLHVQDIIALNFSMKPGSIVSSITEEPGAPLIQAETAMLSTSIDQTALSQLPSLTRNPYDFVSLSPGVIPLNSSRGPGYALNGQRSESGNFLLDGSDNNEPYNSGPGQIVPLEAVQEYRLITHNATAEFGRNAGYIANVITKTGTNDFHGNAYYFLRDSRLAANTFENNARGISKPIFQRRQLGGSLGGPLLPDRLFFFATLEPVLVRSSATLSYYVPTPQLLAVSSPGTNAIFKYFPIPQYLSSTDVSYRTVCPFGRICGSKPGAGYVTIPAFAATTRNGPVDAGAGTPQDTYLSAIRLDYNPSAKTSLNGRYAFQNMDLLGTVQQPYSPLLDQPAAVQNQNVTVNLTRFWTGGFFTETRVVYNRLAQQKPTVPESGFPAFAISGDTISGSAGSLSLPSGSNGYGGTQNSFQFHQTANWIKGRHNWKAGFSGIHLRDYRVPTEVPLNQHNLGEFRDVQGLVLGLLSTYQLSFDPKGHFPGEPVDPPFGASSSYRHSRFNDLSAYLQDTWRLSPRLTFSPGLRFEYFGARYSREEDRQLDSSFYYGNSIDPYQRIATGQLLRLENAPAPYQGHLFRPSYNWAPRLGLALDLHGNGRTVVRAGAGVYWERLPGYTYENLNPPGFSIIRLTNQALIPSMLENPYVIFPSATIPLPPSTITHFDQELKTAYSTHVSAMIEHELARSFVVSAGYIRSRGHRLYRYVNDNRMGSGIYLGRPDERLYNLSSGFVTINNQSRSSYDGFQLRFESSSLRNLGLEFGANYTWSHSLDNASSLLGDEAQAGSGLFPLDAFNPQLDKGSSDFDLRHRMIAHASWLIPFGGGRSGWPKQILHGWELEGIFSTQSGLPFGLRDGRVPDREIGDTSRPLVSGTPPTPMPGSSQVPDTKTPNSFLFLPLNPIRDMEGNCLPNSIPFSCLPSVNGPFTGALGRNVYHRPGVIWTNLALVKNFGLAGFRGRERFNLQVRAEFYNFFNHSNLYIKTDSTNLAFSSFNSVSGSVPGVVVSYGTPERGPQEARQVVLAIKLVF